MILFQVRGNGTVFYPSEIEPWASELGGKDPGWNPLETAIQIAHQFGIQLHAWMNVLPGWSGKELPVDPNHLYNAHPDWFMQDGNQQPIPLNSHYVWLNPVLPEVQKYLSDLVFELAQVKNLDGVHFDYFRYPGPGLSYDQKSLELFKNQFGLEPTDSTSLWSSFRRDAITNWLSETYNKVKQQNPNFTFSSAVIGDYDNGPNLFLQDSHRWLVDGIIDIIFPMVYTEDSVMLDRWLERHKASIHNKNICPGLMVYPDTTITQKQTALVKKKNFPGVSFFAYSNLFPSHRPNNIVRDIKYSVFDRSALLPEFSNSRNKPYFDDIKCYPNIPTSKDSIRIIGKIKGIEQDSSYRVFGIWKNRDKKVNRIKFTTLSENPEYWYNTSKINPQKPGDSYSLQLFAYKKGNIAKTTISSEVQSILINSEENQFKSAGTLGPWMTGVTKATVDRQNNIWIHEPGKGIRVFNPNGDEIAQPPILEFMDEGGQRRNIHYIYDLETFKNGNIAILASSNGSNFILTNSNNVTSFSILCRLPISGSDFAISSQNYLYILNKNAWYVVDQLGQIWGKFDFDGIHTPNNISVTPDGKSVFVACRTEGTVHHWIGEFSRFGAIYKQISDLPESNVGMGEISCDPNGLIYLASTPGQYIKVLDKNYQTVDFLLGGKPGIQAPRSAVPSPDGNLVFVIEIGAATPVQMLKWESTKLQNRKKLSSSK